MATNKLPKHLLKGGKIPLSLSPMYYYNKELKSLLPYRTIKKQPRTLNYSLNFDYENQLKDEYPDLEWSILDKYKHFRNELMFNNAHIDHNNDEIFNKLSNILTPYNLYQTIKIFSPNLWSHGGLAEKFEDIPNAGDMYLSDSFGEICLSGKSNSGKSSLVNRLMGSYDFHEGMAVVSKKPGRTQFMNFYSLDFHFSLVDLMGYGYAIVDKKIRQYWLNFLKKYFTNRSSTHLKHIFVLIDTDFFVKRGKTHSGDDNNALSPNDHDMLTFLDDCYVPYSLIITKADCVNIAKYHIHETGTKIYEDNMNDDESFELMLKNLEPIFEKYYMLQPFINITSARCGFGIVELEPIFEKYYMLQPFINITSARCGFGIVELECIMCHLCELFKKKGISMKDIKLNDTINQIAPEIS